MNKPAHLSQAIGDQFADQSIVDNYSFRPPYSAEVIQFISESQGNKPLTILDVGCGTGEVSIPLAELGHTVVGVDPSAAMIAAAKTKNASASFHNTYIEEFTSDLSFDLVVAANSIHWPDWSRAFPKLKSLLAPKGQIAIVTGGDLFVEAIQAELLTLIKTYSTTKNFQPYDVITMLSEHRYIVNETRYSMPPITMTQPIEDYIASFHARNGFSLDRMDRDEALAFDEAVRSLVHSAGFREVVKGDVSFTVTLAKLA
jgi:trans-aconitate methyltransferase